MLYCLYFICSLYFFFQIYLTEMKNLMLESMWKKKTYYCVRHHVKLITLQQFKFKFNQSKTSKQNPFSIVDTIQYFRLFSFSDERI